jgi:hypothetical protein
MRLDGSGWCFFCDVCGDDRASGEKLIDDDVDWLFTKRFGGEYERKITRSAPG